MKNNIIKFIIIITIISLSSGCTPVKKLTQPSVKNPITSYAPDSSYYFFTRAQIARKKGDFEKAIEYLEKAIKIDPESLFLKRELALVYAQKNNTNQALVVLNKILKKNVTLLPASRPGIICRIKDTDKCFKDSP